MRYRFDTFTYDSMRMLLLRDGVALEVSRRVYACLSYLIENRKRVIKRDELIRKVWGRDNVSDHQMAQVIRAARQVLGDDGNCQSMIRTVMGVGYHWAAEIVEIVDLDPSLTEPPRAPPPTPSSDRSDLPIAPPVLDIAVVCEGDGDDVHERLAPSRIAQAIDAARHTDVSSASTPLRAAPRFQVGTVSAIAATALLAVFVTWHSVRLLDGPIAIARALEPVQQAAAHPASASPADSLALLQAAMAQGRFDTVRTGLAQLPDKVADSAAARSLDIELNIDMGRWPRASQELKIQQARADAAGDPAWQAQLLILESKLKQRSGAPKTQSLAMAQAAVQLLQSMPATAASELLARAKLRRAGAWLTNGQLDNAALAFTEVRDMFLKLGDLRHATQASCGLARVWMRQGRLTEALQQIEANTAVYVELDDPVSELMAHNTALRLQVELLRLPEALATSDRAMQLLERAPDSERRFRTLQLRAMVFTGLGRLREAESILEDADARRPAGQAPGSDRLIPAMHQLASQNYAQALDSAAAAFVALPSDPQNILLDGREGALLLWVMAAQGLASDDRPLPVLSAAMRTALQKPESTLARIAYGRWQWVNGQHHASHSALNQAMADARQQRQLLRMLLAGNALMDVLIEDGQPDAAAHVLAVMRTAQPERIDPSQQNWRLEPTSARLITQRD